MNRFRLQTKLCIYVANSNIQIDPVILEAVIPIDKQVIYMPVYLIYDSEVVMQMGVYEIASTELPNILDEDGDVDLDLLSPPFLQIYHSNYDQKMLEEISEKESKQEADAAKAAADEDASKAAADEDAAKVAVMKMRILIRMLKKKILMLKMMKMVKKLILHQPIFKLSLENCSHQLLETKQK